MISGSNTVSVLVNTSIPPAINLAVTQINGGVSPTPTVPFSVAVQSRDLNGNAANVLSDTNISLTLKTGTASLAGTATGTIKSGTNSVTISGVTYSKEDSAVVITTSATSGDSLSSGDSSPFTVNNPVPAITSLNPASAAQNSDNVALTINGSGFVFDSVVKFAGSSHSATFADNTKITMVLSATDLATIGPKSVVVVNPSPGGGTSNEQDINVFCTFSLLPTSKSFLFSGGSSSVNVTTGNGCSWSATPSDPWIHITDSGSGSANGMVSYSIDENDSLNPRSGTIGIGDQFLQITQAGEISGDVNGDQQVTVSDLVANILAGNFQPTQAQLVSADVFQDGQLTIVDLVTMANFIAGNIKSLPVVPGPQPPLSKLYSPVPADFIANLRDGCGCCRMPRWLVNRGI